MSDVGNKSNLVDDDVRSKQTKQFDEMSQKDEENLRKSSHFVVLSMTNKSQNILVSVVCALWSQRKHREICRFSFICLFDGFM